MGESKIETKEKGAEEPVKSPDGDDSPQPYRRGSFVEGRVLESNLLDERYEKTRRGMY
jgi:hypothetical protein